MTMDKDLKFYLYKNDFFAKQDLIDSFSDWCADLGITVYDARSVDDEYNIDLYLVRRTPLLRSETVFVRTGHEINQEKYEKVLELIKKSSQLATWNVFLTTPLAIYKIGLKKFIKDMEREKIYGYI